MLWKIAATIALLIVAMVFVLTKYNAKNTSNTEGGISVTTQYIENKSIAKISVYALSDGSIVRLNTGSSIRLGKDFGLHSRDIYLEGEGYFEVAKDASKPFHVYAGKSVTTAIGTAFTVRAYKGEINVKILLIEGKVRVENTGEQTPSVELMPKQQVLMYDNKISPIETIANVEVASRWKDGYIMTFKETPFRDVVGALSVYYKKPITGFEATRLADAKITAEFDKTASLSSILEALAFANGFTFTNQNDTIKIKY
jgi:transmembrane sensor